MTRYTQHPLPGRKYTPGQGIHPDKEPGGTHVPAIPAGAVAFSPETWQLSQPYLYAIDLFNLGYWWEAHEVLEKLWIESGKTTEPARFIQGIIQIAAALLKDPQTQARGISRLVARGRANLGVGQGIYCGIRVDNLIRMVELYFAGNHPSPPQIELHFEVGE